MLWASARLRIQQKTPILADAMVCSRRTPGSAQGAGAVGERQRPTAPTAASGTFNPLCRVLCTIRSLYLSAVGPVFILSLATDTPCGSDYTPKQTYSVAQPGMHSGRGAAVIRIVRDYHPVSRAFPGVLAALTATPHRRSPGLSMSLAKPSAHERADGPDDGSPFRRGGTRLCCQFIRHYRSSRDYFLFLCRVICLSSAGDSTGLRSRPDDLSDSTSLNTRGAQPRCNPPCRLRTRRGAG